MQSVCFKVAAESGPRFRTPEFLTEPSSHQLCQNTNAGRHARESIHAPESTGTLVTAKVISATCISTTEPRVRGKE